jgi:hypothetical protein
MAMKVEARILQSLNFKLVPIWGKIHQHAREIFLEYDDTSVE